MNVCLSHKYKPIFLNVYERKKYSYIYNYIKNVSVK